METLIYLLQSEYGIKATAVFPAKGGFSTKAAFQVIGDDGTPYFVKTYDQGLPTTRFFVERISQYMPALHCLSAMQVLKERVLSPIPTKKGTYQGELEGTVYVVFHFVSGDVPGIQGMTKEQTVELAEILAALHENGDRIPFETPGLREDLSLPFCSQMMRFLDKAGENQGALSPLVSPYAPLLHTAVSKVLLLRDTVRSGYESIVLCHGDAHGNNVIQSTHLVLADWEDLRWAPPEADLFIHAWHPHGGTLLEAYAAKRKEYAIHSQLLTFYVLRRRLEDVWVNIQRLTQESPSESEATALLLRTRQGLEEVQALC